MDSLGLFFGGVVSSVVSTESLLPSEAVDPLCSSEATSSEGRSVASCNFCVEDWSAWT